MSATSVQLRFVSDLHIGESCSPVARIDAMRPLLEDAAHLVLNGDTIETLYEDLHAPTRRWRDELNAFLAQHPGRVTVLTGNHDPTVSAVHHFDFLDGRALATHGDVIFPDMTPWGWERSYFVSDYAQRSRDVPPEQLRQLEFRLALYRATIFAIRGNSPRLNVPGHAPWRRWRTFNACFKAHRILRAWRRAPTAAAEALALFRPEARLMIFGHVHRPGVWRRDGRVIVNTGSTTWPFGGVVADLTGDQLVVRELEFRADSLRPGRVRETIPLAETFARATGPGASMLPRST